VVFPFGLITNERTFNVQFDPLWSKVASLLEAALDLSLYKIIQISVYETN